MIDQRKNSNDPARFMLVKKFYDENKLSFIER